MHVASCPSHSDRECNRSPSDIHPISEARPPAPRRVGEGSSGIARVSRGSAAPSGARPRTYEELHSGRARAPAHVRVPGRRAVRHLVPYRQPRARGPG
ncbi:Hypothetical protein AA314_07211 [Archangium gephyra]|uniref:Uncharacterized protein n=1 Tax=Archangium gephyra TaxID=48 RepID=A0AAC8QE72_9BACT|nr:Hypothetical protein AA314_07211 [Archangium gephyra]